MTDISSSPISDQLYTAEQTRQLDRQAIASGIDGYALMCRAGEAALACLQRQWPQHQKLLICCGVGNNAGDGFVLARLAKDQGYEVETVFLGRANALKGEASDAYQDFRSAVLFHRDEFPEQVDHDVVIVDAIFGTGLNRDVSGEYFELIAKVNALSNPVLALDVPSGLCADTGKVRDIAVHASLTLSFIGKNIGLFIGDAKQMTGSVVLDDLQISAKVYAQVQPAANLMSVANSIGALPARQLDTHKGHFGHVLLIGGNSGFAGAITLAAESCARLGAGLTSVFTLPEHLSAIISRCPEVMVHTEQSSVEALIDQASHIVIGPGLGQNLWAQQLLTQVLASNKPCLLDADALNLVATSDELSAKLLEKSQEVIITPHPGEAARLLNQSTSQLQSNRLDALEQLLKKYSCTVLLKGAGSLVASEHGVYLCSSGNPYMASGGMGDVLSGMTASLWAQGLSADQALRLAVCLHAESADDIYTSGRAHGLLASDLIPQASKLINTYML